MRKSWSDSSGIFGMISGAIVVALVARYGFTTADNGIDGIITAVFFGIIAVGALFGHARAVRHWREQQKLAAGFVGLVSAIAFLINLSNSVGFIAARGDKQQAERAKAIETANANRAELARKEAERASIGAFVATDAATVRAAERAADTATNIRAAECAKRGPLCRQREAEETLKATELATATANKATTNRAADIDWDIKRLKEALETAKPVVAVNPFQATIGRLFRLKEDTAESAATWQQFAVAAIVELLIVAALVSSEIGHQAPAPTLARNPEPKVVDVVVPEPMVATEALQIIPPTKPTSQPRLPTRQKPKLAIANEQQPLGAVLDFLHDGLVFTSGPRLEMTNAFIGYVAWCKETKHRPMGVVEFVDDMVNACKRFGIRIEGEEDRHYLMDVELAAAMPRLTAV